MLRNMLVAYANKINQSINFPMQSVEQIYQTKVDICIKNTLLALAKNYIVFTNMKRKNEKDIYIV